MASSRSVLEFPLTVIPSVPGSLGPGVGQAATTAMMANVHTFPLTLEEV